MDIDHSTTLAELSEEGLLAALFPSFRARAGDLVGPGDDAAVVQVTSGSVVVTTDTMVRGRDWLDAWSSPADVATKCLTQNVADVAAMGATPTSLLLALVADPATPARWVLDFASALGQAAQEHDVSIVGGDLSSAPPGTLVLAVTALGDLGGRQPVLRSGARAGDQVAVAGSLGRSGAGLHLLQQGRPDPAVPDMSGLDDVATEVLAHHRRPLTPVAEGARAALAGASSMLDISDGLLRDGDRLARASGVAFDLSRARLAAYADRLTPLVGSEVAWECVLAGGEEHSLLATFPLGRVPPGWGVIGTIRDAAAGGPGVLLDGEPTTVRGWDHFAG